MTKQTSEKDLVGTWELLAWKVFKNGEFYKYPMEEDCVGQLIYTNAGIMNGFLMRKDFENEAPRTPAPAAKCLSYSGTYRIEGDEVIHDVFLATIPEWIGNPLIRTMEWQGDQLLLKTEPEKDKAGNGYSNTLLWRRRSEVL